MKRLNFSLIFTLMLLVGGLYSSRVSAQCQNCTPVTDEGAQCSTLPGNPSLCNGGIRIDPPVAGTYDLDAFGNTVTVSFYTDNSTNNCGQMVSWSVSGNIVIDYVIVKGGNDANKYDYTSLTPRPSSDSGLHSPVNASGKYAAVSHIDFCYHYRLDASKTATAGYTRNYDWSISKSCNGPSPLTLSTGQTYSYPFSWTASVSGYTDSDWNVTGTITIANNTPYNANITGVTDVLSNPVMAATVDCGVSFPYTLGSGGTLNCTYSADLTGAYNGTNTVTVTTNTPLVEGDVATADYTFGNPTTEEDDCITVSDNCTAGTTNVCRSAAPKTVNYNCNIGPYAECGNYSYTNTASFSEDDSGRTGSNSCTVTVNVPCGGCTLTIGYWKTHSEFGPAPYDDTWAQLPDGASTTFFLSGQTYYQVAWTAPAGNVYYILAHQYIAAQLNQLNGASIPPAVLTAFNSATTLFNTYTPAQMAAFKGANRNNVINLATILDNYNNGISGPGHCSEGSGSNLEKAPGGPVMKSQAAGKLNLAPNPASTQVQIGLAEFVGLPAIVEVYNPLGALVWSKNFNLVETPVYLLQLDDFATGVYNVTLTVEGQRLTQTLVVQREK